MDYLAIKHFHMTCAALSFGLFFLRGWSRFTDRAIHRTRWARILPHLVDSALLASALVLAYHVRDIPAMRAFVVVKAGGVVIYILLGMTAFRWAKSPAWQRRAWVAALLVFAGIVTVAFHKV